ncbi:dephospho-CoA kinase [Clostridium sp. Cult3]|uniref:dephospho-CoA kinase n=1 Tax=Clostridium sp. Cult3 TaxID=2079004 RepID=UPI001EEED9B1|nr:dephospho-CoA kinase [Clostridium sp. Cult3]MCF6459651.1 dephospho-CoA kinase [Clostridium sp. Cult3]
MRLNDCKIIGLTGGIATGKTTVTEMLINKGFKVIDADKIARQVVEVGSPAYEEIVTYFGESILNEDKTIDRKKLGDLIFKDETRRKKLNNIIHPYILETIKNRITEYKKREKIIFIDVPLLIEEIDKFREYEIIFDEIWLVYADKTTQLNRLIRRDNIGEEEAIHRVRAQIPMEMKRAYATKIIDNRGDIKSLGKQLDYILREIR